MSDIKYFQNSALGGDLTNNSRYKFVYVIFGIVLTIWVLKKTECISSENFAGLMPIRDRKKNVDQELFKSRPLNRRLGRRRQLSAIPAETKNIGYKPTEEWLAISGNTKQKIRDALRAVDEDIPALLYKNANYNSYI